MRKAICLAGILLVSALTMIACGEKSPEKNKKDEPEQIEAVVEVEETTRVVKVDFQHAFAEENSPETKELAIIKGLDADGNTVWTYETEKYLAAQLDLIQEIGIRNEKYYILENGSIVARDLHTGNVLWKNSDFEGGAIKFVFGANDTLYCCGYLGPDFFAVDKNGKTLKRIATFNDAYCWPESISCSDTEVTVCFEAAPYEDAQYKKCIVSLKDYSFKFPKPIQAKSLTVSQMCDKIMKFYNKRYSTDEYICFPGEELKTSTGYDFTLRSRAGREANVYVTSVLVNTNTGYVTDELGNEWNIYE